MWLLPFEAAAARQHLRVTEQILFELPEQSIMPELPEVETVRRGLQPAMEGARIVRAETRRGDLRFPFQKDFVARLEGQTVAGLGRRAKYLMADLDSGDVLLDPVTVEMSYTGAADAGKQVFSTTTPLPLAGAVGYTVRVLPRHPMLADSNELGLVTLA